MPSIQLPRRDSDTAVLHSEPKSGAIRPAPISPADDKTARAWDSPAPQETWRGHLVWLPLWLCYVGVVAYTSLHHEPWLDEAQAWLIARDCSFGDLFMNIARYEGSPVLWHLLLALPAKCGLPYGTLQAVSVVCASLGMAAFFVISPLPRLLTALVPFSFYLFYQHAVVARSYVVMPLLMLLVACAYRTRLASPWRYVAALAPLANINAHGFFLSCALAVMFAWEVWRRRKLTSSVAWKRSCQALVAFGLLAAAVVWQLRVPADSQAARIGEAPLGARIVLAFERLSGALTDEPITATLVFVLSLAWFYCTGVSTIYLAMTAVVMGIFTFLACAFHHEGLLFFVWLFCLVLSFAAPQAEQCDARTVRLRRLVVFAAVCLLVRHASWSYASIRHDLQNPYSGSRALAEYLRTEGLADKKIYASDTFALAASPYFDRNIFANVRNGRGSSFLVWSKDYLDPSGGFRFPFPYQEPFDVLVLGVKNPPLAFIPWDDPAARLELASNYRCVGYFPGNQFFKTQAYERDDFVCFVRNDVPARPYRAAESNAAQQPLEAFNLSIPADWSPEKTAQFHTAMQAYARLALALMIATIDRDAAIAHLRAAVAIDPDYYAALVNLAALLEEAQPQEALVPLRRAAALAPRDYNVLLKLAHCAARSEQLEEAYGAYATLVRFYPRDPTVCREFAMFAQIYEASRTPVSEAAATPGDK